MQNNTNTNKQSGVSLLVVLLLASIMMLVGTGAAALALRAIKTTDVRGVANKTLYTAEDAFACVRSNVNLYPKRFSNSGDTSPEGLVANPVYCGGIKIDFTDGDSSTGGYTDNSPSADEATMTFSLSNADGRGGVYVAVVRNMSGADPLLVFKGTTTVFAYSEEEESARALQRLQEYYYEGFLGADIMFVVDRSGSIGVPAIRYNKSDANAPTDEWWQLVSALADSISVLYDKVPEPYIGLVSFGTDVSDIGRATTTPGGLEVILPDVSLLHRSQAGGRLPSNGGTRGTATLADDDPGELNFDFAETNLAPALAIAGAELMGKYYPYGDHPTAPSSPSPYESGGFEYLIEHGNLNNLEDQEDGPDGTPGMEREDALYADYIIIITDGDPNGIVRYTHGAVQCTGGTGVPSSAPGDTIFFQTVSGTAECYATMGTAADADADGALDIPYTAYKYCNDEFNDTPFDFFSDASLAKNVQASGEPSYAAMCNISKIANALKNKGITIATIGVGVGAGSDVETWMKNELVSDAEDGTPLYRSIDDFDEVGDALDFILEKLQILRSL